MSDADLADIERTIRYWRRRYVIADVAAELHCGRNWSDIQRCMVKWWLEREIEALSRQAA